MGYIRPALCSGGWSTRPPATRGNSAAPSGINSPLWPDRNPQLYMLRPYAYFPLWRGCACEGEELLPGWVLLWRPEVSHVGRLSQVVAPSIALFYSHPGGATFASWPVVMGVSSYILCQKDCWWLLYIWRVVLAVTPSFMNYLLAIRLYQWITHVKYNMFNN